MALTTLLVAVSVILLFFVSEISFLEAKNVQVISFQWNASSGDPSSVDRILLSGDATFDSDTNVLELTDESKGLGGEGTAGRASYNETISLWDASTKAVANFTTHFQFRIYWDDRNNLFRDVGGSGLAFFMARKESDYNLSFKGKNAYLGLFNSNNDGNSSNQVVAVEFDTYNSSSWDKDGNHIGIDVNTIRSTSTLPLQHRLNGGEIWDAQIDYRGRENLLEVLASCNNEGPWKLSQRINLTQYLPEDIVVGFSAAGYHSSESHKLIFWNFTTTISRKERNFTTTISRKERNFPWKVAMPIGSVSLLFITSLIFCIIYIHKKRSRPTSDSQSQPDMETDPDIGMAMDHMPRNFTYAQLSAGTENFSESYKLGHGGFGDVYKAILVSSNDIVAVKRISAGSRQGIKEYVAEISTISRLRHKNLVQLLGWCHERARLMLVYEYMSNGSLDKFLFGERRGELDWSRRYRIASDIASALLYLHEEWDECVVHRDIKSSNVLLDSKFTAKLGDFGLARLVKHNEWSQTNTIAGTLGYLAPECAATGISSAESDVFSFGAVALEIACGKRALESGMRLVEKVWGIHGQGRLFDAADRSLNGEYDRAEMETLITIGLSCSHPDPFNRPTMRRVLQLLNFEVPLPLLTRTPPKAASPLEAATTSDFRTPVFSNSQEMREFSSSAACSSLTSAISNSSISE